MKIQTTGLEGEALNYAVVMCEFGVNHLRINGAKVFLKNCDDLIPCNFSIDWAQAGPIIEREGCFPSRYYGAAESRGKVYQALAYNGTSAYAQGPTPIIAALRCYVASKLGPEVEVPDKLVPHLVAQRAAAQEAMTHHQTIDRPRG